MRGARGDARLLLGLAVVLAALTLPFVDRYPHVLEGDSENCIAWALELKRWLVLGDPAFFQEPLGGYPPYFDAQSILYSLVSLVAIGPSLDHGHMVLFFRYANACCWIGSVLLLYASARLLTGWSLFSLLLALVYAASDAVLALSLLRIDHFVLVGYLAVIYLSLRVASGPTSARTAALLGAVLALVTASKISSVVLCIVALPAVAAAVKRRWWGARHGAAFAAAGATLSALLFVRYIHHAAQLGPILSSKYVSTQMWRIYLGGSPWFYNWQFPVEQYGRAMMVAVYLAVVLALRDGGWRSPTAQVVLLPLLVLSLFGASQMKYAHFALSFLPLYLLTLALALRLLGPMAKGRVAPFAIGLLPLLAAPTCAQAVWARGKEIAGRKESIEITRVRARAWLDAHVRPRSRIGYYAASEVTLPPMFDSPLRRSTGLFDFPYLDPERLRSFRPPSFEELEGTYDLVALSDCHRAIYRFAFEQVGALDRAAEWDGFVRELAHRYPAMTFRARTPNYCVSEVSFYVLNPTALRDGTRGY
jgi:hypothetical protein